eukprot:12893102-Prorocentrum_lima.AAC.1
MVGIHGRQEVEVPCLALPRTQLTSGLKWVGHYSGVSQVVVTTLGCPRGRWWELASLLGGNRRICGK